METWQGVLNIDGYSSAKVREVLNKAVADIGVPARILEVGSYRGSTAAALCHGNDVECIHMVDNHSEFGDTRDAIASIVERFNLPATIHDFDYFAPIPPDTFGGTKFNVYFYDGPHDEHLHAKELAIAWPHLADSFLYIVDDYAWDGVRRGCESGIAAQGKRLRMPFRYIYPSTIINDAGGYWNGLLIAHCTKRGEDVV